MTKRQRERSNRRDKWNKRSNDGGGVLDYFWRRVDETFDAGDSTCRPGSLVVLRGTTGQVGESRLKVDSIV